ncbi:MAG TPA: TetR/AcrR family transcriptional regulator [Bacillota bacterium]|nr:TetR/AcrR family transcriptional regulator [Bacillota bacterium]
MDTARQEEILDAFIKIGTRKGLNNTTMQDIAKEVGISVGTIYLYFKNKDELVDAFIKRLFEEIEFYIQQVLKQDAPAETRLHDLLVGDILKVSKHMRENQSLFDLFNEDFIKHIKKDVRGKRRQFENERIGYVEQILKQGVQEGVFEIDDISETAKTIFIAFGSDHLRGPFVMEREHKEVESDAEALFALILKSIKKR